MADQLTLAEFSVRLPGGGYFTASWPRCITVPDLRMLRGMLTLTLDWWIDKTEAVTAGEAEYASWQHESSTAASGVRVDAEASDVGPQG